MIHNTRWANTGELGIEPVNGMQPIARLSYSFQDGYATFALFVEPHPRGKEPKKSYVRLDGAPPEANHETLEQVIAEFLAPPQKVLNERSAS